MHVEAHQQGHLSISILCYRSAVWHVVKLTWISSLSSPLGRPSGHGGMYWPQGGISLREMHWVLAFHEKVFRNPGDFEGTKSPQIITKNHSHQRRRNDDKNNFWEFESKRGSAEGSERGSTGDPSWNFIVGLKHRKNSILESRIFIVVAFSQEIQWQQFWTIPPPPPSRGSD